MESNHNKYLTFGVNLIQNMRFYYEQASLVDKQKLIGSIFPENLIIENGECRTARENEIIAVLRGFERDFRLGNPDQKVGVSHKVPGAGLEPAQILLSTGF